MCFMLASDPAQSLAQPRSAYPKRKSDGLVVACRSLSYVVAGAGFEPATALGHRGDTGRTDQVHPAELQQVSCGNRGQIGTREGHPGDVSGDAPCCAYVAHSDLPADLARLAGLWDRLPEATRAAIWTLAEGARREYRL